MIGEWKAKKGGAFPSARCGWRVCPGEIGGIEEIERERGREGEGAEGLKS